jgi:hypothetical protein
MKYLKPISLATLPFLVVLVIVMLAVPCGSTAGEQVETTSDDQTDVAITIYNDGTGLVKDTRSLELPNGEFDLIFMDVAANIDPTSVHFISRTNPDAIGVLEQNYEYDLVDTAKLYQRHIDHHISVRTEDGRTIEGTLLSNSGGMVISTENGIVIVNDVVEVSFEELPEGLMTRPTLRWSLLCNRAGRHDCEMSYLTSGMGWIANYVAIVGPNDDRLDLSGWVTITNNSGTNYNDATLKLVAGDIHRVRPQYDMAATGYLREGFGAPGGGGFEEESFFEYHLYTLQRPATVLNNQQKQLSLLEGENIGVTKILIFQPGGRYYNRGDSVEGKIRVSLEFMNSEANGLGIPLPKGTLRVYKEDSSGALQFIGEDSIDHTPKDEKIEIYLGEAFDIVGERVVLDRREVRQGVWEYDVKVTIRNHKDEDVQILYWDYVGGDWEVRNSSLDFTQRDASTIEFKIPVEANGETDLTYTIRQEW